MKWFRRQTAPATIVLCGLIIVGSLFTWFAPRVAQDILAYPGLPFPKIWTLFTYPFIAFPNPIFLLFSVMWMYFIGTLLERDHGSTKFVYLWLAISAIGVLPLTIFKAPMMGALIPDAVLVTIWGTRYPDMVVRLFMCIPVKAKWIAVVSVAVIFFNFASGPNQIFVGLAAISSSILGFLYAKNMIPKVPYGLRHGTMYAKPKPTKAQIQKEKQYYDDVYRREKEREERERLRKLFEDSLGDEK